MTFAIRHVGNALFLSGLTWGVLTTSKMVSVSVRTHWQIPVSGDFQWVASI